MFVTKRNGKVEQVHFDKITSRINKLVKPEEKKYIDPILVAQKVVGSIFSGITTEELDNESAKICINLCTSHHLYSMLAGRIVVSNLHKKTINTFVEKEEMIQDKLGFLEPKWLAWIKENRDELNNMIDYERDYLFDYFGFKTLERAYLTKIGDQVIERPQDMLMRVASFINCGDLVLVKKTYDMISQGLYTHASPTLFNAGNQRSQLASCFEGNTLVNTLRGPISIKDVEIGDEVITHLGNVKKVIQKHKNEINSRKLYNVNIRKTNNFIVTEDHKLFAYNTYTKKSNWKMVKDLESSDYIMIPKYDGTIDKPEIDVLKVLKSYDFSTYNNEMKIELTDDNKQVYLTTIFKHNNLKNQNEVTCCTKSTPINLKINIDNDFIKFIGIWFGDGHIMHKNKKGVKHICGIGITIHNENQKLIDFCTSINKYLGIKHVTIHKMGNQNVTQVLYNCPVLGIIFNQLYGKGFGGKQLPTEIYKYNTKLVYSFLSGLVTTDGCVSKDGVISLCMANKKLIEQIYSLCRLHNLDCGKVLPVKMGKLAKSQAFNILLTNLRYELTDIWKTYKDDRIEKLTKKTNIRNQSSPIVVDKFKYLHFESREEITIDDNYVYTLGVEDDHSYSIEGIIAQNCFLLGTDDSLEGITKTWADVAKISKWGGGIGLHVSNIRAKDTMIKGTNGPSSGIIPMLKVYNEIARYIDQCFIGSTKVYTQRGLIPIEEIKPNDKVFTQDGSLQEVEKVYCDKYENKILNFKIFHDYESIKVTPTHPFYVVKNQPPGTNFSTILKRLDNKIAVPEWIDAKNITENDLIGFPIPKYVLDNRNLDEADCYMYGLMLGASSYNEDRNEGGITLGFKKDAVICFVREYLKTNGIHFWETITESTIQIRWTTSSKFKFVRAQLYDINSEKHIDESMLHLPEDKSKWIIKGVLDTDGCIGQEITLEMTSQNVIDGVKYLILRMGILCSGYSRDRIGNVSTYKNITTTKLTWVLRIPKAQKIAKLLDIEAGQFFKFFAHENILYTRLKEVTEEDIVASVYDLEIKNNHNYLTQAGLVHNGGKRKGSIAIYLEPHHPDVLSFLELKKNFGAETERARDLFLAMWLSDVFMKQVEKDGDWHLMCPDKCPGLTDAYGEDYEKLYWSYVEAKKYNSVVKARQVMKAILDSQLETGTPYIGFKDNINNKSNQKNIGTIKSSNLCVHEDTMILTDQGYKNIKSLKDNEVNIWNGEQWSKVIVKQTGTNQNLVRVNLSNGVSLDCTPEHKFYIQEGFSRGNIIETEASKLKIDNKLIKFNLPPAIEFENPTEFKYAYTHGAFCGDGTTYDNYSKTKKYPKLYLYGAKKDLLQYIDYQSYTENTNADRYDITLPKDLNPKFMIPENASINTRLRWFEGYCDTDGTIARNDTNESLQIGSTNKDFLVNIRLMLHTLGIESKVTKNYDERLTMMPDHKGGSKQAFRLLVGSNDLYQLSLLGFSPKQLKYTPRKPQRNATQFVKVTSVEESYKNVDTYCFTEPLKHMGVFNGVLTGQCHEILEYSDASEYAVCNLASIAINKCVEPFANKKLWTIYTKDNCKFCQWTKSYLMNNGYFFHEEYVDSDKLKEITGLEKPTYPQIYYGDQYVGGYSDFFQFTKSTFDYDKLYEIAYLATINLNKIIDVNYYPVIEAKRSNIRHRPIAVGIQGLADALVQLKICFDSDESLEFNAKMMETIYLACLTASCDLSKERENKLLPECIYPEFYDSKFDETNNIYHKLKPNTCELGKKFPGAYSTFKGSPISQGQFQFDMWSLDRNKLQYKEKWVELEERIKKYGVRNSLVTALMPTASTSQILGNNECFEFFTNNIYTRRTLAGDFPLVNKYLIDELNNIGLWSTEMKQMILANNGSIANFSNIPEQIKNLYKTIWEIKQIWVLKNAAARGPFVDQTQSMNIFMAVPDYQKLYSSHFWAWSNGLKTGIYYLRSRAAKDAVKVTVDPSIQKRLEQITNDDHEVCENCSA